MYDVGRKSRVEYAGIFVRRLPHFLSDHCRKAVLAPRVGICKIVFQLPEDVLVVLYAALVGVAGPVAEVEHRLVAFALAPSEIKTDFRVPYEVLYRCDVSENASRKFLPVEQDVILHCDTDRIRIGVVSFSTGQATGILD